MVFKSIILVVLLASFQTFGSKSPFYVSAPDVVTMIGTSLLDKDGTTLVPGAGGGVTGATQGNILFGDTDGTETDDDNLFWDNSSKRLGVGTSTPATDFHINRSSGNLDVEFSTTASNGQSYVRQHNDAQTWQHGIDTDDRFKIRFTGGGVNPFVVQNAAVPNQQLYLTTGGVTVNAGGSFEVAKAEIEVNGSTFLDNDADQVALRIDAHTTQNENILEIYDSSAALNYGRLSTGQNFYVDFNGNVMADCLWPDKGSSVVTAGTVILDETAHCKAFVDTSGASVTLEPTNSTQKGIRFWGCKADSTGGDMFVDGPGTEPVNTVTTQEKIIANVGCARCQVVDDGTTFGTFCESGN